MSVKITPKTDNSYPSQLLKGGIQKTLEKTGRLPPVALLITPLDGSKSVFLDRFLTYKFKSSILIPVDTFEFTIAYPDDVPFYERVKDGDIVTLTANDFPLATGIIDIPDIETDNQFGERVAIIGRDLMSQFEDQSAVSAQDEPIWSGSYTVGQAVSKLLENTRIRGYRLQDAPSGAYLFATQPGESKLSALQRFLEPLNCLSWMDPGGKVVIGRPNMAQKPKGNLYLVRSERRANVMSMKSIRNATSIANIVLPIWSGQESVQERVAKEQRLYNAASGPSRLRKLGHRVPKTVVVSTPQATSPQDLSGINDIIVGGANLLQAHAKREIARENHKELIVQAVVPGHYNEMGEPYSVDTVYHIRHDRGSVDENMYLFDVEYMAGEEGIKTVLTFCRLGTIVSDVRAQ